MRNDLEAENARLRVVLEQVRQIATDAQSKWYSACGDPIHRANRLNHALEQIRNLATKE